MSLINKMLKEVEKREAKQPGEAKVPFRLQRLGFAKGRTYGVLLWLIWIIVFALLFFVAYQYFYGRGMMQHALVKDVHRRPVAIEASQLAVASTLQQISWSTKAQGENVIRLELNKAPPFTVHKDNRQYVVELQDTNPISQMKLPDVAASTVIQSLQLQQKQNNLAVVIVLKVPVKLQRVMHRSGGHTDLLLVFVPEAASVDQSAHLQSQVEKAPLTPEEKAQQAYQSAIAMAESGQLHSAAKTLGTIVRQWPENSDYRYSLGVVLYQQGQYQPALTLVNQGLKSANDIRLITLKAQLLAKLGQPQQALALMGRYHPDLKEHIGFYSLIAALENQNGQYQLAQAYYEQLLAVDPHHSVWWMGLGIALEQQRQNNSAVSAYQRAISTGQLSPTLTVFVQNKLKALQKQ